MPKKTIISHDFDGCLDSMTEKGLASDLSFWPGNSNIRQINGEIRLRHKKLISEITAGSFRVDLYCGSVRQSKIQDYEMACQNKNGSAFAALRELCQSKTTESTPWKYQPLLYTDVVHKLKPGISEKSDEYTVIDPVKIELLKAQMWDAHKRHHKSDKLDFYFIDDNGELFPPIIEYFKKNSREIPPNMSFTIILFDCFSAYQGIKEYSKEIITLHKSRPSSSRSRPSSSRPRPSLFEQYTKPTPEGKKNASQDGHLQTMSAKVHQAMNRNGCNSSIHQETPTAGIAAHNGSNSHESTKRHLFRLFKLTDPTKPVFKNPLNKPSSDEDMLASVFGQQSTLNMR